LRARVDFHSAEAAAASALVPGVEAIDSRSVYLAAKTTQEFVRRFQLLTQVLYGLKT
jgi:D-aminopeptidase